MQTEDAREAVRDMEKEATPEPDRTMEEQPAARRVSTLLPAFLLIAMTLSVYAQVWTFPFLVFDDAAQIVNNESVHSWSAAPSYFTQDVWQSASSPTRRYYRPFFLLWLLVNYKIFGLHPMGWHAALLLLYVLSVFLLWRVLLALEVPRTAAFFTSLLFAVHPVHVESVAWLSGATDPLLGVFVLGGLLSYLKWSKSEWWGWLVLSAALALAAMWTKEVGLALPILMLLHDIFFAPRSAARGRQRIALWLAAAAPVAVYALTRAHAVHIAVQHSWLTVVETAPMLAWFLFRQSFWPVGLAAWYDMDVVHGLPLARFWIPFLLAVISIVAILVGLRRRSLMAYFGAFWWITIAASLAGVRVFENHDIAHDRYNYLSVAAVCFLVVSAMGLLPRVRTVNRERLVLSALVLVLAVVAVVQLNTWRNNEALYRRGVAISPRSPQPRNLLVSELMKKGQLQEALQLAANTVQLDPQRWENNFTLGVVFWTVGQLDASEQMMRKCIQLDRRRAVAYVVLAKQLQATTPEQAVGVLRSVPADVDDPKLIAAALRQLQARPSEKGVTR